MNTRVMAHRGASGYAPENTMEAFEKALSLGADGIELDVHICKSGELVVIHDEQVDRTTNGSGFVKDLSLTELKALDAGSFFRDSFKGAQIPTLIEVLDLIKNTNTFLNIELKNAPILYPQLEERTIQLLHDYHMTDRCILSSFNHYSLRHCKEIDAQIKTGILYAAGLYKPWDYCKTLMADAIHPLFYGVNPEIVMGCKANHIAINTWTVNEEDYMLKLAQAQVEGLITNYPDKALAAVKTAKGGL